MDRLVWIFVVIFLLIRCAHALAQDTKEYDPACATVQDVQIMVENDHTLSFPRRVKEPFVDRAIAFYYSQTVLHNSKYWTDAILIDKVNGGGMILVGDGPDSFCEFLLIKPAFWPVVKMRLEEGTHV